MSMDALRCLARIKSFQDYWKDSEPERVTNRKVLDNGPDAFAGIINIENGSGEPIVPTVLNYYVRLRSRVEAKCFDESPELSCPREATGSEEYADAIGRLASRITEESRLQFESRDGIGSIMTEGGYGIVYGMPNLPSRTDVDERAKGTAQILEQTVMSVGFQDPAGRSGVRPGVGSSAMAAGTLPPEPPPPPPVPTQGQDHATIAKVLMETATDQINVLANPPEVTEALIQMAAAHMQAQQDEEKSQRYWRYDENAIFTERVEIGSHLIYDLTYGDWRRGSYLAHAIELSLDEAKGHPLFKPGVSKRLVVTVPDGEDFKKINVVGETEDENKAENGVVKIWVYYDKKARKVHYVPEALESGEIEFLEKSDENPYVDDNGDPLLPWFWPVAVFAYRKRLRRGPHRGLPIPYMRNGWDQQIESINFDTAIVEGTKAAMQDKYLAHSEVDDDTLAAITNGRLHVVVKRPPGLERGEEALKSIEFKPPLKEAYEERAQQGQRFCQGANFPWTEFSGQPLPSTTLGQTEIATSSGSEAMSDLQRMGECFYAEVVQGLLIIASAKMPAEVAAEYMGVEMEKVWDGWRQSVRRGDMVRVKFAPTTREMNPVRAKQLMEIVGVAQAMADPVTTFPMVAPTTIFRLFNEACKNMGVGGVKPFVPTPQDVAMLMAKAEAATQQNSQNSGGGGKGGGQDNRPQGGNGNQSQQKGGGNRPPGGGQSRQHGPPGRGQIESAARRS